MSVISTLNSAPYFDDYSPETKDFLRVLFKPGYAVQARELNQLQAILQTQVQRFGSHIFNDGSLILGGQSTLDVTTARYLVLLNNTQTITSFVGATITGGTSGAIGLVVAVDSTDPNTLIYRPLTGLSFSASESVAVTGGLTTLTNVTVAATSFTGSSSTVSIDDGIFFTQGSFVICPAQTVYLNKTDNIPTKKVGLVANITTVNSTVDTTLLDNANGSYNYAAPGADRLLINLVLTALDINSVTSASSFIEILRVDTGVLQQQITGPSYSEILKVLARRTYDTNGDFIVNPFVANLEVNPAVGATGVSMLLKIAPGKAFVRGFEISTIAKQSLTIQKARTTATDTNHYTAITYGNYATVTLSKGQPTISSFQSLYLYQSDNTTIGTARARNIEYSGTAGSYNLYLFDVTITYPNKTFTSVTSIGENILRSSSNQLFLVTTPAGLSFPGTTSLVYDTGYDVVDNLSSGTMNVSYRKQFTVTLTAGSGTFQTPFARERFQGPVGAVDTTTKSVYYVVTGDSSNAYAPITTYTLTLGAVVPGNQQTATINAISGYTGGTVTVTAYINNSDAVPNTKTLAPMSTQGKFAANSTTSTNVTLAADASTTNNFYSNLTITSGTGSGSTVYTVSSYVGSTKVATLTVPVTVTTASTYNVCPTFTTGASGTGYVYSATGMGTISLGVSDVTRIVKIITTASGNPTSTDWFNTANDVTGKYTFDTGQRDNYYDLSSVTLGTGQAVATPVVIFFEYLSHGINDGFFCANSYSNKNIPQYYNDSTGRRINLFNTIDCRPTKLTANTFVSAQTIAAPNSNFISTISYYLPRIDKIVVTSDGKFLDITGIPSKSPKAPADIDNSLDLYTMYIPAYTYATDSVSLTAISNKRYTMNDISKLENRIVNLEYYAALSALEQSTSTFNVVDANGNTRFNNSILVDSFTGTNISDVFNPDNTCSIDIADQELRPAFLQRSYGLSLIATDGATGYIKRGDLVTAAFDDSNTVVSQPQATTPINLNPFSVFDWVGSLAITPNNDTWYDIQVGPVNLTSPNGIYDNFHPGAVNPYGSLYNQWNNLWYGVRTTTSYEDNTVYEDVITYSPGTGQILTTYPLTPGSSADSIFNTPGTNVVASNVYTGPAGSSISSPDGTMGFYNGTGPAYWSYVSIPNANSSITTVPRSVTNAVTSSTNVPVPPPIGLNQYQIGNMVTNIAMTQFIRSRTLAFSAVGLKPFTTVYAFFDGKNATAGVTPTGGVLGGTLTTNAAGAVSGTFTITLGAYYTGSNIFLLTDNVNGTRTAETTGCQTTYKVQGLADPSLSLNSPLELVDATSFQSVSQNQPQTKIYPLAQTFYIDNTNYPEGIFLSKADLFFATKDPTLPLTVQIRDTSNGYPSPTNILSTVTISAASVNTSTTGTVATTVTFPNVVYLKPGEYCIVLIANSNLYAPWAAVIGQKQIGSSTLISQRPYVGNIFRTQNASSWTADVTTDLAFNLYYCKFSTTYPFVTTWSDYDSSGGVPTASDNIITINTVTGSTGATLYFNDITAPSLVYGAIVGSTGATGAIPASTTITGGSVTAGSITLSNTLNYPIQSGTPITFYRKPQGVLRPNVIMVPEESYNPFSSTSISQAIKGSTGPGVIDSTYTTLATNKNFAHPSSAYQILTADESFRKKVTCSTTSQYVSPVLNATRQSVIAVQNVVNNVSGFTTTLTAAVGSTGITIVGALAATGAGVVQQLGATSFGTSTPTSGVIINGAEQINITGALGATGITVVRGYNSTTPAATGALALLNRFSTTISVADALTINNNDILNFTGATGPGAEFMQVVSGGNVANATNLTVIRGYNGSTIGSTGASGIVNDITLDETRPTGGGAYAKYITRPVVLNTNSSYIKIYLTANKPANSNVLVYYKVLSADDSSTLASKNWTLMQQVSPATSTYSTDPTQFIEYQFLPYASGVTGATQAIYYKSGSVTYTNFIQYAIKIVMLSADPLLVPRVSDFRSIVLQ
jgi:hypothetical protein